MIFIRAGLAGLILFALPAHAGWFQSICQRALTGLVAEDPYPYAEEPFEHLVAMYLATHNHQILQEIVLRYRLGIITDEQRSLFDQTFRSTQK